MFFIIIHCNSSLGRLFSSCGFGLRVWYWLRNLTSHISPQFMTLEKDSHILKPCMITSRTIQHNGDRTYDISFILLIHNEENDQKVGFGDLKCRNGAQNRNLHEKLSKTSSVENFFTLVKVNNQRSGQSQRLDQRLGILTWQCDVTLGLTWQYAKRSRRVEAHDSSIPGAWSACS